MDLTYGEQTESLYVIPKRKRVGNISRVQKKIMLDYFKDYPYLMLGKYTNNFTLERGSLLWAQLAEKLNKTAGGPKKDWKLWRKTFHDLRCRLKTKIDKTNLTDFDINVIELLNEAQSVSFDELLESCGIHTGESGNTESSAEHWQDSNDSSKFEGGKSQKEEKFIIFKMEENRISYGHENLDNEFLSPITSNNDHSISQEQVSIGIEGSENEKLNEDENEKSGICEKDDPKQMCKNQESCEGSYTGHLKRKLALKRNYQKQKLGLMRQLLKVKQQKLKAKQRESVALMRIAKTLEVMAQNR